MTPPPKVPERTEVLDTSTGQTTYCRAYVLHLESLLRERERQLGVARDLLWEHGHDTHGNHTGAQGGKCRLCDLYDSLGDWQPMGEP